MQTKEEARYRMNLAREHLEKAREELSLYRSDGAKRHLAACVASSQICVENSAKAVVACFGIPSKSHDPSGELSAALERVEEEFEEGLVENLKSPSTPTSPPRSTSWPPMVMRRGVSRQAGSTPPKMPSGF